MAFPPIMGPPYSQGRSAILIAIIGVASHITPWLSEPATPPHHSMGRDIAPICRLAAIASAPYDQDHMGAAAFASAWRHGRSCSAKEHVHENANQNCRSCGGRRRAQRRLLYLYGTFLRPPPGATAPFAMQWNRCREVGPVHEWGWRMDSVFHHVAACQVIHTLLINHDRITRTVTEIYRTASAP